MGIKRYSKSQLIKAVRILYLCERESISTEQIISGNFTHRCKCPFSTHKSGKERTQSLYIDSINNNFYCFGCGASNNSIDFYMLLRDIDFSTAITELSEIVSPDLIANEPANSDIRKNNFSILLEISSIFRSLYSNEKYKNEKWLDDLSRKTDLKIESLEVYDTEGALKVLKQIKSYLSKIGV
jgi:DNA primase